MADVPGFRIPNDSESFDDKQQELHKSDVQILGMGPGGTGVTHGCAVTAQGTPDQTVAVAVGQVIVAGKAARVAAGNVSMSAAHATLDRYDLVTVDSSGTKGKIDGTAASNPDKPDIGSTELAVLAEVFRPATDDTISTDQIIDKRVFERNLSLGNVPMKTGWWLPFPEGSAAGGGPNCIPASGTLRFVPLVMRFRQAVDRIAVRAAAAYTASPTIRFGIWYPGSDGLPGVLRTDYGSATVPNATGEVSLTISDTIDPGLYWLGVVIQGTMTGGALAGWGFGGLGVGTSIASSYRSFEQTGVSGALPDPASGAAGSVVEPPVILLRAA